MFLIVGIALGLFLSLLILVKKNKSIADGVLVCWLLFTAFHIFLVYAQVTGLNYLYPHTLGIILPLPVLHGPFLYTYARAITRNRLPGASNIAAQLLPFVLLTVLATPFFMLNAAEKIHVFQNDGVGFEWYVLIQNTIIITVGFAFTALTVREVYRHRHRAKDELSNIDHKMLGWLFYLSMSLALIWLLAIFFNTQIIIYTVVVFVIFIGVFGINQVPVFYTSHLEVEKSLVAVNSPTALITDDARYKKSSLSAEELSLIMRKADEHMKESKAFTNSELTLDNLSDALGLPPQHVSQAINSVTGQNFYHYINTLRIHEFLELVKLPENKLYKLQALAFDSGFQSKTTFNKYFRIVTGKTPSEYLDSDSQ